MKWALNDDTCGRFEQKVKTFANGKMMYVCQLVHCYGNDYNDKTT